MLMAVDSMLLFDGIQHLSDYNRIVRRLLKVSAVKTRGSVTDGTAQIFDRPADCRLPFRNRILDYYWMLGLSERQPEFAWR